MGDLSVIRHGGIIINSYLFLASIWQIRYKEEDLISVSIHHSFIWEWKPLLPPCGHGFSAEPDANAHSWAQGATVWQSLLFRTSGL
jgi:hypothetical protein